MVINLPTNAIAQAITIADLRIGNIFVREKDLIIKHYAVFSHFDKNGVPMLAENQPETGTAYISLEKFLQGGRLLQIKEFNGNPYFVRQQLNKLVGDKKYSLVSYNCEHFVNEVTIQKAKSEQVDFVKTIAAYVVVIVVSIAALFYLKKLLRA